MRVLSDLDMTPDRDVRHVKQDVCRRGPFSLGRGGEDPLSGSDPLEVTILDPGVPLVGMAAPCPRPQHGPDDMIDPSEAMFRDDMAMIHPPAA